MKSIFRFLITLALPFVATAIATPALAGQYMSAGFCQPYQHGGVNAVALYYQSQGSILAAADTNVFCPLQIVTPNQQQHVKVYFASQGVQGSPAISCTFWKLTANNLSAISPQVTGAPGLNAGAFDIYSPNGSPDTISMNLNCNLKKGAKILGYYVY